MTLNLSMESFAAAVNSPAAGSEKQASPAAAATDAASTLRRWFGVDFTILDGGSGDVLHLASDQPCRDWSVRAELCQEVARRGQAEFIEEDHPLLLLAVPVHQGAVSLIGVAAFLTRSAETDAEIARAASFLRCDAEEARRWVYRQSVTSPDMLERLAALVLGRLESERRIETLESEVDKLSLHVASTYEEISLIYRLTQNLRINAQETELGRMALEWLVEIMPCEGMALLLLPCQTGSRGKTETEGEPRLITYGHCPIGQDTFLQMVRGIGRPLGRPSGRGQSHARFQRPLEHPANPAVDSRADWRGSPALRLSGRIQSLGRPRVRHRRGRPAQLRGCHPRHP